MSDASFNTSTRSLPSSALRLQRRSALPVVAIATALLMSGCAMHKRDSVIVGSVPDDYRTSHPIVIGEQQQTLDLPVGASSRGATRQQRESLEGFLVGYDRTAAPVLNIISPMGSPNAVAAADAAHDFASVATRGGIPSSRIMFASYQAGPEEASAPVRISYAAMRSQTDKCGRWPKDILETSENKHYANFGCPSQNNLAAQVANPAGPARTEEADANRCRQPRCRDR